MATTILLVNLHSSATPGLIRERFAELGLHTEAGIHKFGNESANRHAAMGWATFEGPGDVGIALSALNPVETMSGEVFIFNSPGVLPQLYEFTRKKLMTPDRDDQVKALL